MKSPKSFEINCSFRERGPVFNIAIRSVSDPYHFDADPDTDTDPDPRIRFRDDGSGSG